MIPALEHSARYSHVRKNWSQGHHSIESVVDTFCFIAKLFYILIISSVIIISWCKKALGVIHGLSSLARGTKWYQQQVSTTVFILFFGTANSGGMVVQIGGFAAQLLYWALVSLLSIWSYCLIWNKSPNCRFPKGDLFQHPNSDVSFKIIQHLFPLLYWYRAWLVYSHWWGIWLNMKFMMASL